MVDGIPEVLRMKMMNREPGRKGREREGRECRKEGPKGE
jgi:hypothetical protein